MVARKGQSVERLGRVHRRSELLPTPEGFAVTPREILATVAAERPGEQERGKRFKAPGEFDLHAWVRDNDVPVKREGEWGNGGYRWILEECLWNPHTDNAAYIVQGKEGWIYASCSHDSCKTGENRWFEVREYYEPGAYDSSEYAEKKASYSGRGSQSGSNKRNARSEYAEYADFIELPEVEEFPVDALPDPAGEFVKQAARSVECPADLIGLPVIAVLSSAISNSRRAEVKRGWTESPTVCTAVIASSGSKKSPADKVAQKPVDKVEAELKVKYDKRKEEYERKLKDWEADRKEGPPVDDKPERPTMEQVVLSDTTIEALFGMLANNYRGVLVARDELSGWVRALDQYKGGKGSDRQHWLSLWMNKAVRLNRKGAPEPTIIPHPFASLHGGIQPHVLPELIDNREDGLLDRFLLAYPDASWAPLYSDYEVDASVEDGYEQLYRKLRELKPDEDEVGNPFPKSVKFTQEAKTFLVKAINRLGDQVREPGFPARLEGIWSKLEAYLVRLSLIIALTWIVWGRQSGTLVEEVMTLQDVRSAARLIKYFQAHARRVIVGVYGESRSDKLAEKIALFLTRRSGSFTGTPTELDAAFDSDAKPGGVHNLTRALAAIASRTPRLSFSEASENYYKDNGKRTKRRIVTLTLEPLETAYSAYSGDENGDFKPHTANGVSTLPKNHRTQRTQTTRSRTR